MLFFRVLKEWKKKLKRKRRPIWTLGIGAAVFLLATLAGTWGAKAIIHNWTSAASMETQEVFASSDELSYGPGYGDTSRDRTLSDLQSREGEVEIVLHRNYLCGEETRKLGRHTAGEAYQLLLAHREWNASISGSKVLLEEEVDDLSPQCRKTAMIGIDQDGNLSLFDGEVQPDNVIRTFFQLDVDTLQSSLSKEQLDELQHGIRVSDKDEYNSVISTFSDFARVRSKGVLNAAE